MTSPLSQSSSSAPPSLIPFEDMAHREYFLSYATGVGLHIPTSALPDGVSTPTLGESQSTFMTSVNNSVAPPASLQRKPNAPRLGAEVLSVEEERASHPDWNASFQDATEAGDAGAVRQAIAAFETEVASIVRRLVLAKTGVERPCEPLCGFQGRYLHRGVYYLDCTAEPELLKFYGCVEGLMKGVSAEVRAMRHMWKTWERNSAFVPLGCSMTFLGARFFAVALPPVNALTVVGGPEGVGHVRTITHICAKAVENASKRLGMADLHISDDHKQRLNDKGVWCSIEAVTHFALDKRPYIFEVARALPPTEPRLANALLGFASVSSRPPSRTKSSTASSDGEMRQLQLYPVKSHSEGHLSTLLQPAPNRLSNWRKRLVAYRLVRPEMMRFLKEERVEVPGANGRGMTPMNIVNAIDGVTSLACTPLADARSTELAAIATSVVIQRGVHTLLGLCSPAKPLPDGHKISAQHVAELLHEAGVNLRYLGDIYRGVERAVSSASPDSQGQELVATRPESMRLPSLLLARTTASALSGPPQPSTARVHAPSAKAPKPPTGSRTSRAHYRKPTDEVSDLPSFDASRVRDVLTAIKVEGIARVFRAVVEEHWRVCLRPPRRDDRDSFDKMADASVVDAAERSFRRTRQRTGGTKASELLTELKFLGAQLEVAGDELKFVGQGECVRSLSLVEGALCKSTMYCSDGAPRLRPDVEGATPVVDIELKAREVTAKLLTFLAFPGMASDKFWEVALSTEVWTKYNGLGQRQELRAVPVDALLSRVSSLLLIDFGDVASLIEKAEVAGGVKAQHIRGIGMRCKGFATTAAGDDAGGARLATGISSTQAMERAALERKVRSLREGPPTQELLTALSELEQRLVLSGADLKSQLMLVRLKQINVTARLRETRLRELWSRNGLDGIVYVACGRCPLLVNLSARDRHHCMSKSDLELAAILGHESPQAVVDRLPVPVGLADGTLLDAAISASSFREGCQPEFARLECAVTDGWEPHPTDRYTAWLQLDLGRVRSVCSIATQGTPTGAFCRSYRVSFSSDRSSWSTYQGGYTHDNRALKCDPLRYDAGGKRNKDDGSWIPVASGDRIVRLPVGGLFGNTDSRSVVVNTLEVPLEARYVRIHPGADGDFSRHGLRVELYVQDDHAVEAALLTPGTERVPLHLVDLEAPLLLRRRAVDEMGRESAVSTTRATMAAKEIEILERINSIENDVLDDCFAPIGRARVIKHSSTLPGLYEEWIDLLDDWGAERAGDISVASSRLAAYLIGEAEWSMLRSSGSAPSPTVLNAVAPLIFASSRQSKALEPLLRRLRKLFDSDPAIVLPLFKRVARWVGRGNLILPYLAAELAQLCDGVTFLNIAQVLLDESIAVERQPTEADGPAHLDDDAARRSVLLVYTHRKFRRVVESAERIAVHSELSIPVELEDLLPPAPV